MGDTFTHPAKPSHHRRAAVLQQAFIYPWRHKSLWISSGVSKSFWSGGEGDEIIWISNLQHFALSKATEWQIFNNLWWFFSATNMKMISICRCHLLTTFLGILWREKKLRRDYENASWQGWYLVIGVMEYCSFRLTNVQRNLKIIWPLSQ